jgi:hypothetical protein
MNDIRTAFFAFASIDMELSYCGYYRQFWCGTSSKLRSSAIYGSRQAVVWHHMSPNVEVTDSCHNITPKGNGLGHWYSARRVRTNFDLSAGLK